MLLFLRRRFASTREWRDAELGIAAIKHVLFQTKCPRGALKYVPYYVQKRLDPNGDEYLHGQIETFQQRLGMLRIMEQEKLRMAQETEQEKIRMQHEIAQEKLRMEQEKLRMAQETEQEMIRMQHEIAQEKLRMEQEKLRMERERRRVFPVLRHHGFSDRLGDGIFVSKLYQLLSDSHRQTRLIALGIPEILFPTYIEQLVRIGCETDEECVDVLLRESSPLARLDVDESQPFVNRLHSVDVALSAISEFAMGMGGKPTLGLLPQLYGSGKTTFLKKFIGCSQLRLNPNPDAKTWFAARPVYVDFERLPSGHRAESLQDRILLVILCAAANQLCSGHVAARLQAVFSRSPYLFESLFRMSGTSPIICQCPLFGGTPSRPLRLFFGFDELGRMANCLSTSASSETMSFIQLFLEFWAYTATLLGAKGYIAALFAGRHPALMLMGSKLFSHLVGLGPSPTPVTVIPLPPIRRPYIRELLDDYMCETGRFVDLPGLPHVLQALFPNALQEDKDALLDRLSIWLEDVTGGVARLLVTAVHFLKSYSTTSRSFTSALEYELRVAIQRRANSQFFLPAELSAAVPGLSKDVMHTIMAGLYYAAISGQALDMDTEIILASTAPGRPLLFYADALGLYLEQLDHGRYRIRADSMLFSQVAGLFLSVPIHELLNMLPNYARFAVDKGKLFEHFMLAKLFCSLSKPRSVPSEAASSVFPCFLRTKVGQLVSPNGALPVVHLPKFSAAGAINPSLVTAKYTSENVKMVLLQRLAQNSIGVSFEKNSGYDACVRFERRFLFLQFKNVETWSKSDLCAELEAFRLIAQTLNEQGVAWSFAVFCTCDSPFSSVPGSFAPTCERSDSPLVLDGSAELERFLSSSKRSRDFSDIMAPDCEIILADGFVVDQFLDPSTVGNSKLSRISYLLRMVPSKHAYPPFGQ
jgi:hypothetical protein